MTTFLIAATLMTAAVLFFVLPPLFRTHANAAASQQSDALNLNVLRDQLQELNDDFDAGTIDAIAYQSARKELQQRVAEDVLDHATPGKSITATDTQWRWPPMLLAMLIPAVATILYLTLGTPSALDATHPIPVATENEVTSKRIAAILDELTRRVREKPSDSEAWKMIARASSATGQFSQSVDAYAHLVQLLPNDAEIYAEYAQALGMSHDQNLQGEPERLAMRALKINPNNVNALALAGGAAYQRRDFVNAVVYWRKILPLVPVNSNIGKSINNSINEALKKPH